MRSGIEKAAEAIRNADAVVIGAGAGLSTAAGFTYSGARFQRYFADAEKRYGFHDMYSGGFYPYPTPEEKWAVWSRNVYVNRYMDPPKPVYENLLSLVRDREYFVITTNVDHCFQKVGIDKARLFYTQGDYGLFQCGEPCHDKTYDNEDAIRAMVLAQGFEIGPDGELLPPASGEPKHTIPLALLPRCPVCGGPMEMNLRSDDTFVEDEGWYAAAARYDRFLKKHRTDRVVYLEVGVGFNTPGIIKYPFWRYTHENKNAVYVCMSHRQSIVPREIEERSIILEGDAGNIVDIMNRA